MFQPKCKICRSRQAQEIEFSRYYLGWSYKLIVEQYSDDIDELSSYNLSTHFSRHTSAETKRFWREVKAKASPIESAELSEQANL